MNTDAQEGAGESANQAQEVIDHSQVSIGEEVNRPNQEKDGDNSGQRPGNPKYGQVSDENPKNAEPEADSTPLIGSSGKKIPPTFLDKLRSNKVAVLSTMGGFAAGAVAFAVFNREPEETRTGVRTTTEEVIDGQVERRTIVEEFEDNATRENQMIGATEEAEPEPTEPYEPYEQGFHGEIVINDFPPELTSTVPRSEQLLMGMIDRLKSPVPLDELDEVVGWAWSGQVTFDTYLPNGRKVYARADNAIELNIDNQLYWFMYNEASQQPVSLHVGEITEENGEVTRIYSEMYRNPTHIHPQILIEDSKQVFGQFTRYTPRSYDSEIGLVARNNYASTPEAEVTIAPKVYFFADINDSFKVPELGELHGVLRFTEHPEEILADHKERGGGSTVSSGD